MLFVEALPIHLRGFALTALRDFDSNATDGGARVSFWSVSSVQLQGAYSPEELRLIADTMSELARLDAIGSHTSNDQ